MSPRLAALVATVILPLVLPPSGKAWAAPEGQLTWALHFSLAPIWFDPGDHPGVITPMVPFYARHDALAKPMPGQPMAPSLAESWSASRDGLSYEFVLRRGVKFHNGDVMTADDVKVQRVNEGWTPEKDPRI